MCGSWRLDEQDLNTYRADGLLKAPFRISDEQLGRMRESLDQLMSDNAHLAPETLVCPHIPYGKTQDEAAAREWLEYARHPGILDLVSQLIGEDIILWGSQVFCKPPLTGKAIPWHQDGQYWPIRPIATCSVWIALDDAMPENGCMRYIPGSHASGSIYRHRVTDRSDVVLNQEVEPRSSTSRAAATISPSATARTMRWCRGFRMRTGPGRSDHASKPCETVRPDHGDRQGDQTRIRGDKSL